MHDNQNETPEDVDRHLSAARRALQEFEDGVDQHRLLMRLRAASPAHPVLIARFVFRAATILCVLAAIVVLVIALVNTDLARILQKFEAVMPLPEEVPALPALLGFLALMMGFAWFSATLAARALGRDSQMLPWEQKQHQKLVNEVTRLTTQRAVIERIRNTPAGARPRIATPVPVGTRRATPGVAPMSSMPGRGATPAPADPRTSFGRTPAGAPALVAGAMGAVAGAASSSLAGPPHSAGPSSAGPSSAGPSSPGSASPGSASPGSASPGSSGSMGSASTSSAGLGLPSSKTSGGFAPRPGRETPMAADRTAKAPQPGPLQGTPKPLSSTSAPLGANGQLGGARQPPPLKSLPPVEMPEPQPLRKGLPIPVPSDLAQTPVMGGRREPVLPETSLPIQRPADRATPNPSVPSQPSVSQPSVSQPSVSQPSVSQPSVSQPSASQPTEIRSAAELAQGAGGHGPGRRETPGVPPSLVPTLVEPIPESHRLDSHRNRPPVFDGAAGIDPSAGTEGAENGGGVRLGGNRGPTPVEAAPQVASAQSPYAQSSVATQAPPPPAGLASDKPSIVLPKIAPVSDSSAREPSAASRADGILGRTRAGEISASRKTPYGSAGRVRIHPVASLQIGSSPILGKSTRGGTPLGAPPKAGVPVGQAKPRLGAPLGFPGTPPSTQGTGTTTETVDTDVFSKDMYQPSGAGRPGKLEEAVVVLEDEETEHDPAADLDDGPSRKLPSLKAGSESWLQEALNNADTLLKTYPPEATLELSKEPNLPFTLVISKAAPALAVRAMVHFVEFLSSISTPPRARIELVGVAPLDRSFHKNVEAALVPYFGENFEVRPGPGQVDIRFTDPDPLWSTYPRLPLAR
jgi:hypothetical protein